MKIIGVDPGTRHLGWGIIVTEGTRLVHVAHGIVHTTVSEALAFRLCEIDDALRTVIREHAPEEGAVESLFFAKDPQAASKLGHARGVVLLALSRESVAIYEYPPARVKRAVSGRGRASKQQVALMVKALLNMTEMPGVDATDALAVAITHAHVSRVDRALRAAQVGRR